MAATVAGSTESLQLLNEEALEKENKHLFQNLDGKIDEQQEVSKLNEVDAPREFVEDDYDLDYIEALDKLVRRREFLEDVRRDTPGKFAKLFYN